jgi:hypothetical protein
LKSLQSAVSSGDTTSAQKILSSLKEFLSSNPPQPPAYTTYSNDGSVTSSSTSSTSSTLSLLA